MLIPIYDRVALLYLKRARTTLILVTINTALFVVTASGLFVNEDRLVLGLGLIPAVWFGEATRAADISLVANYWTAITSQFLHGGLMHLAANMLFLWVFGDNVEDAMGSLKFAVFYLLCGAIAGLAYAASTPDSRAPLIGASGAISGVATAYLLLYPRVSVVVLFLNVIPIATRASIVIGLWIAYQVIAALLGADSNVGWWAHVGGAVAGALLLPFFKRREVPLLGNRQE